jgi:excisionase family DNA binding protein
VSLAAATAERMITPPEIAERLAVDVHKILQLIRCGELPAVNLASRGSTRPRFRVSPEALTEFLKRRTVRPPVPRNKRPRAAEPVPRYV